MDPATRRSIRYLTKAEVIVVSRFADTAVEWWMSSHNKVGMWHVGMLTITPGWLTFINIFLKKMLFWWLSYSVLCITAILICPSHFSAYVEWTNEELKNSMSF